MNCDEQLVYDYLRNAYGPYVVYEPEPNSTPDFCLNSYIAVEVRRLNKSFFNVLDEPKGIETLSFSLYSVFREILKSFDMLYSGTTYWVSYQYRRPLESDIHKLKKEW